MNRQIMYVMSGSAHCPYLVTSLFSLRQQYQGPIRIHAWEESFDVCARIAEDSRLQGDGGLEVFCSEPPMKWKKNKQFGHKILLAQKSEADVVLYLDADTTIHGSLDKLFEKAHTHGFCATQFNNWKSNSGVVPKRIRRLEEHLPDMYGKYIEELCRNAHPSLNGGVWACRPNSCILKEWYECTEAARSVFIPDEAVLHLMMARWEGRQMYVIEGGLYNMSARTKFWPDGTSFQDIRVLHYHGDSNCRPDKAPQGSEFWYQIWQHCLKENIGNVLDWRGDILNRHLRQFEAHKQAEAASL